MSEGGIAKGKPWFDQLAKELNGILFGIYCVTPENKSSDWMLWEAGFLSCASSVGARHVAPLAVGMSKGEIRGPLSIYQATDCTRDDLWRLIGVINAALHEDKRVAIPVLERTFGYVWPHLEKRIAEAVALPASLPSPVPEAQQMSEILALLRDNQREIAEIKVTMTRPLTWADPTYKFVASDPTNPAGGVNALWYGDRPSEALIQSDIAVQQKKIADAVELLSGRMVLVKPPEKK
jgi:hypothetical protein